ncbi:MAG: peptide deformylase [Solirubrobacteraceae bacterium]|jgi:peptide deformylase|nr:peptide deformylase [Solirubrobacteraceae bacterium]
MTVLEIVQVGNPVLRSRAQAVSLQELASPDTQAFIDDLIETKRAAHGAGLAANQVGDLRRIAVVEVEPDNPRYPYKPPIALTVLVNPELALVGETVVINEGCLSVPDLRGDVPRAVTVRVRFLDRDGVAREEEHRGLAAGTFQHEVDHLNGVLFLDRADPRTFSTWDEFERRGKAAFLERIKDLPR